MLSPENIIAIVLVIFYTVYSQADKFSSVALAVNTNETVVSTILVFTTKRRSKNFD